MNPLIIGVMANAGSGKDTMADHLVAKYGFVKMSLADPIKRVCRDVYDFSEQQLWGPSQFRNEPDRRYPRVVKVFEDVVNEGDSHTREYREHLSPRVALQICGTEFGRACYPNTWVDLTIRNAKKVLSSPDLRYHPVSGVYSVPPSVGPLAKVAGVVIPDCRFRNEVDAVHGAGGLMVRLKRTNILKAGTVGVQGHASEMEQMSIPDSDLDYVVDVEEGLENFYRQVDRLMVAIEDNRIAAFLKGAA